MAFLRTRSRRREVDDISTTSYLSGEVRNRFEFHAIADGPECRDSDKTITIDVSVRMGSDKVRKRVTESGVVDKGMN